MNKITALAVFILAAISLSLGQGERYQSQVTTNGLPNPVVRVCTEVASGNPCISLASIFADKPLTTPLPNPFTGDAEGNYFFYGSCANTYHVQIFQNGALIFEQADVALPGCGSGGGGGVNPGTPFQVSRYDPSGNNIQDSTGSDNPAKGPTRWVQGLSVEGNGLAKVGINSPTGTTLNLLVCADPAITSMTQVLTCPVSTNKTFGIADNGAGTTGNVRIYDHGYHPCIFDGQTVVNDYVAPSATVPAACSDVGATKPNNILIIGRVTTLNTGAGTLATVDMQPWDTVAPGSAGGSGTVSNCATGSSNAYYVSPGTVVNCDPLSTDDGNGNVTDKSLGLTDGTKAGYLWQAAGPLPPPAPTGTIEFFPPTALANPFSVQWPTAPGASLQCFQVLSTSIDAGGNTIDNMGFAACGAGTVSSFSSGNLSPLFTTSVATSTSTPALSFVLTNAAANTVLANLTGSSAAPSYTTTQGTDTKVLTAGTVSGTGASLCTDANGGATTSGCSGGTSSITTHFGPQDCTTDQGSHTGYGATNPAPTNVFIASWGFLPGTAGAIYCKVYIPHALAGTPNAKVVLKIYSADGTAGHTANFKTCDVVGTSNYNVGAPTCAANQTYTTTGTAYAVTTNTYNIQSTIAADDILFIEVVSATTGTQPTNNIYVDVWFQVDQTL